MHAVSGCEEMFKLFCDPINRMCCGLFLIPLDKFVGSALRCGQILDFESSAKPNNGCTMPEELLWPLWPCLLLDYTHTLPANCRVSPCPMPHKMTIRPLARHCHQTKIIKLNERNVYSYPLNKSPGGQVQVKTANKKQSEARCLSVFLELTLNGCNDIQSSLAFV